MIGYGGSDNKIEHELMLKQIYEYKGIIKRIMCDTSNEETNCIIENMRSVLDEMLRLYIDNDVEGLKEIYKNNKKIVDNLNYYASLHANQEETIHKKVMDITNMVK